MTKCLHCSRRKVTRPRGLCWPCYYTPGVRELFTSGSVYARRGVGGGNVSRPLPEPTPTFPGTPERIEVLETRARSGQLLWHPDDATLTDRDDAN